MRERYKNQMTAVTTTILKFRREFDAFQQCARYEPVEVTCHGRRAFVLMSAEHYDWIKAAGRRTHRNFKTTAVFVDTVVQAAMDPEHAALDALLK
jgi:prevent-host-death family protein